MDDAEYLFRTDAAEKKRIARGAFAQVRGGYKGKSLGLRQEHMTDREWKKMNGSTQQWNLSKPMNYAGFKEMPDDLKRDYILRLQREYHANDAVLTDLLGISRSMVSTIRKYLKIPSLDGKGRGRMSAEDRDRFARWRLGLPEKMSTEEEPEPKPEHAESAAEEPGNEKEDSTEGRVHISGSSITLCGNVSTEDCASWIDSVLKAVRGNVRVSISIGGLDEEAAG